MSRAFVRERDDVAPEPPPERKISRHPNRVTRRGLRQIEATIAKLQKELASNPDETRAAWLRRDLQYWTTRHATAQLTEPADPRSGEVTFGSRVTIARPGHEPETIEIVGEDESDPASGRLSWVAPMAVALMGAEPGDVVTVGTREPPLEVKVLAVDNTAQ
jgi:transcription elongation GreA/GreB family factor